MKMYYALWKGKENKFGEPLVYDYTFSVRFPNIVFIANDHNEAKKKIKAINSKLINIDRFTISRSKIQRLAM